MKQFVEKEIGDHARRLIGKKKPFVVGITGSVGKSSTKEAVAAVLSASFDVLKSPKNLNTEFGLPLAVLRLGKPKSKPGWAAALFRGCWRGAYPPKDYPDTLVLEMAADHPGDIGKLARIAPPDVAVITAIGESHAEYFGSVEAIAREKGVLVEALGEDGVAVLNRDDDLVWSMQSRTSAKVVSFGFHEEAEIRAVEDTVAVACVSENECGMHFKLVVDGTTMPVFVPGVFGRPCVYAALAAVAVGRARGMNLVAIAEALGNFMPPPGRLRYLPGIKRTVLIDDSYNAAPRSVKAALDVLREVPMAADDDRKFAVLGDMMELGPLSDEGHREVGRYAAECGVDYLVLVGERMGEAEKAALEAGMQRDSVLHFSTPAEAGRFVQERMKQGDAVLVKGSRSMQMEVVSKELMAEPLKAAELLPGEHKEWRL